MTFKELTYLWRADLYRYAGRADNKSFFKYWLLDPGFQYTFYMRLCGYLKKIQSNPIAKLLYFPILLLFKHYEYKYGVHIPARTRVGAGLYMGHPGAIYVHPDAIIGKNCNLSQCVTLGQSNRGARQGYPVVGDNVYIGPGAKIVGGVTIGNNVAIGANCVVTKDIPDQAVVVGVPGRVISYEGVEGYIENIDYERVLR
ncbi:MAG: serine acetyltransferase [Ardenticatenales bacterium]|nr:serine acetyltransferase [Ardenticatenales bacterium]